MPDGRFGQPAAARGSGGAHPLAPHPGTVPDEPFPDAEGGQRGPQFGRGLGRFQGDLNVDRLLRLIRDRQHDRPQALRRLDEVLASDSQLSVRLAGDHVVPVGKAIVQFFDERLAIFLLLPAGISFAADQRSARSGSTVNQTTATQTTDTKTGQLEHTLFWIGILCGIALMLPLPICLYHFRRVGALLAEIDRMQAELRDRDEIFFRTFTVARS